MSASMKPSRKPLKGSSIVSNFGSFETISANNIQLESISIAGLFEDGVFQSVTIKDSEIINTVIGAESPNVGYFTNLNAYQNVSFISNNFDSAVTWDPDTSIFELKNSTLKVVGCSILGNIEICNNDIRAVNADGSINMYPNGTGTLNFYGPVFNLITRGNFFSDVQQGSITLRSRDNVTVTSTSGSVAVSSFGDQTISTVNGDIQLSTERQTSPRNIVSITTLSSGSIQITTNTNNLLKAGDVIALSSTGSLDNSYTVGSVVSGTTFLITTSTLVSSTITRGSLVKPLSNNIVLNTLSFVKIPTDTELTFGATTNAVSGNTHGLLVTSERDIILAAPTTSSVFIPTSTSLEFAGLTNGSYVSTGNRWYYDGTSANFVVSNSSTFTGPLTQINTTNVRFYDPVITLGDYALNTIDTRDRGIEYRYYSSTGSMKTGWFGYKTSTNRFTFIPDATNTNETITGTPGEFEIGDVSANNVTISSGGNFNLQCGQLLNVRTITSCSGRLNIVAGTETNITSGPFNLNSSARVSLNAGSDVFIPASIPLTLGTSNIVETSGNIRISAVQNIDLRTRSSGSIIVPVDTYVAFNGTSVGSQRMYANTSGQLFITGDHNLYLTFTSGNVILPPNNTGSQTVSSLQLGDASQVFYGNTGGITVLSSNPNSSIRTISARDIETTSSSGNVIVTSYNGDINLLTTRGNVRLLPTTRIIFNVSGTSNNIGTDVSGNLVVDGSGNNAIDLKNTRDIFLNASGSVNISSGTVLYLSDDRTRYITSRTTGTLELVNTSGSITISAVNTGLINTGTLSVSNATTTVSSSNFTITGTTGSVVNLSSQHVRIRDPIITLANYSLVTNDNLDRGVEYRYTVSTAGTGLNALGWFGWRNTTGRFTYYSSATNTDEIISGTLGNAEFDSLYLKNGLAFSNPAQIDLQCGTIVNANTITGCTGVLNIVGTTNVNVSTSNLMLNASRRAQLPYGTLLAFGSTSNSISADSNGNMTITSLGGNGQLILNSNVQINGTTTNVFSTVTNITDPIFSLGGVTGPLVNDGKDRGIEFKWNNGSVSKTGFFGYKNNLGRFVFIQDGINTDEVYSGSFGDVQFNNTYVANLDVNGGTISNLRTVTGGDITIRSTTNNVTISSGNLNLNANTSLNFGSSTDSVSLDSSGSLQFRSDPNIRFELSTSGNSSILIPQNVPLYFGTGGNYIVYNTSNNLSITNSSGSIDLTPSASTSSGNINIPTQTYLNFGSTTNSIISDGTNLLINGYSGVNINSSTFNVAGDVNIIGTITAAVSADFDINRYILPLGTSQIINVSAVTAYTATTHGNVLITTNTAHNFSVNDSVKLNNTVSSPSVDGTYTIQHVVNSTQFVVSGPTVTTAGGVGGTVKSNLTTYQGKDVGIQVNYWSTTGNVSLTSGSLGYKTGFFGFKVDTERWVYYNNATISNNVVSGTLSDIQVNKAFVNRMSGFALDGGITGGSNQINGTNFQIAGGSVNSTPIGVNIAQTGRFTQLSNTVSASFQNVTLTSSLAYTFERYTLSSASLPTRNPSTSFVVSMFSVSGPNYTSSSGTMPSTSIADGLFKILVCNSVGVGSSHTIFFGANKLIAPNPLNSSAQATRLVFRRQGQSAQLIFDAQANNNNGAWVLLSSGVYVQ